MVAFVILYLVGFVYYTFLAADFYEGHTILEGAMKEGDEANMLLIIVGTLVQAFILSGLYANWSKGVYSAGNGFAFGGWIGAFVGFGLGLMWYATANFMDMTGTLVEGLWSIVYYGIAGVGIALVFAKTNKAPAE